MDPFRSYYISSILPQLKEIDNERKSLHKKITSITVISVIILTIIVGFLFIITKRPNVFYIYFAIPAPYAFLLKDLIKNYSKKYKEGIIRNLFLSYFDDYTIDTEQKSDCINIINSGLLTINRKYQVKTEDFIRLKHKDNIVCIQEIIVKKNKYEFFKGLLFSTDMKRSINQNVIFFNQSVPYNSKYLNKNGFKKVDKDNVTIFYQDNSSLEQLKPFIEFTSKNNLPLSIQNGKLYCFFPPEDIVFTEKLDLFEPLLTSKYNSNDTYRFIRDEYQRIIKISRLLIKFDETNMA
ncbi:MAG: hypothetical protein IPJ16_02175 [Bacteroidales bacterium]|nr:hypothetical protein [Bacteroidales bacterium]